MADDTTTAATPATWDLPKDDFTLTGLPKVPSTTPNVAPAATPATENPATPKSTPFEYSAKTDAFTSELGPKKAPDISAPKIEPLQSSKEDSSKSEITYDQPVKKENSFTRSMPNISSMSTTAVSGSTSTAALSDMEKQLREKKTKIDADISALQSKKQKLDEILSKISALKSEESTLTQKAKEILG